MGSVGRAILINTPNRSVVTQVRLYTVLVYVYREFQFVEVVNSLFNNFNSTLLSLLNNLFSSEKNIQKLAPLMTSDFGKKTD